MVTEESVLFWTAKDESLVLSEGAILKAAVLEHETSDNDDEMKELGKAYMFEQSLG